MFGRDVIALSSRNEALRSSLVLAILATALAACGGRAAPKPAAAPQASAAPDDAVPEALAANAERDRRGDAGVRAAAKPLVQGGERGIPRCGKLGPAVLGKGSARAAAPQTEAPPSGVKKVGKGSKRGRGRGNATAAAPAPAPAPEQSSTDAPVDLLSGRLRLGPLPRSRALPPPKDGPTLEEESRLVVDAGGEGLAIVTKELFQLDPDRYAPEPDAKPTPGTLDEEAPKFLKATFPNEESLEITPVEIGEAKLRAYAARPKEPNAPPGQDVALALALLVAHPDGTLQSVAFHVKGEMVRVATGNALVGCTRLAEKVARTITSGPRALERSAGTRHLLGVPGGDKELVARVPDDYVAVKGEDFVRLYKLRPLSLYAGNVAVAVGPKKDSRPTEDGGGDAVPGKLLGRDVTWQKKTLPKGGGWLHASEPLEPGGATFADVLVKTRQAKMLDEMQKVAETIALVPRP